MKLKRHWIPILVVIISVWLLGWTTYRSPSSKTVWEYKIVRVSVHETSMKVEEMLNDLGAEGWELVFHEASRRQGAMSHEGYYYFKRPK